MHSETIYRLALRRISAGVCYQKIKDELGVPIRTLALWRAQSGLKPLKPGPKGRKHRGN
jgi:hypothetical protein